MSTNKYEKFVDESAPSRETSDSFSKTLTLRPDHSNVQMSRTNGTEVKVSPESVVIEDGREGDDCYQEFPGYVNPESMTRREKLRHFLEHLVFRLFSLLLIVIDCIMLIIDLSSPHKPNHEQSLYDGVALVFVLYFCLELGLRIYSQSSKVFFGHWYNTVDFVVIILSFLVTVIYTAIDINGAVKLVVFGRLIRVIVLIRLVRVLVTEPRHLQKGVRHVVSENKRRLREGNFDLDLTYITNNVIGMSFPSSGKMALYRNNIKEVAKYMDSQHGVDHYKVYNLCSEKNYDTSHFHGRVARFNIDDHNVPSLEQMLDFAKDVKDWLDKDDKNVIAVHCKGGKGRTGTMICTWLIYNGQFNSSKDVLDYFGDQRTDKAMGDKYQGVETPSQGRYVDYFNKVMNEFEGHIPPKKSLVLKEMKIFALLGVGRGDGSDLTCSISINREDHFLIDFGSQSNCEAEYNPEQDVLTVMPINCPTLSGDIRLKFNCRTKSVPRAYEDCAFYFWFNTSFVETSSESNTTTNRPTLKITRNELDNPHKAKTWKLFRDKFAVQLFFNQCSS